MAIGAARLAKGLTRQQIADAIGRHFNWSTAALQGQAAMDEDEATKAAEFLGLWTEIVAALRLCPMKGSLAPSSRPTR